MSDQLDDALANYRSRVDDLRGGEPDLGHLIAEQKEAERQQAFSYAEIAKRIFSMVDAELASINMRTNKNPNFSPLNESSTRIFFDTIYVGTSRYTSVKLSSGEYDKGQPLYFDYSPEEGVFLGKTYGETVEENVSPMDVVFGRTSIDEVNSAWIKQIITLWLNYRRVSV